MTTNTVSTSPEPSWVFFYYYYPGQKNRYSREIHEVDLQFDHVILCYIELRFDIDVTREAAQRELASRIEVDVA